jgi:hypothetical protein
MQPDFQPANPFQEMTYGASPIASLTPEAATEFA